jgi:hypothetical protein
MISSSFDAGYLIPSSPHAAHASFKQTVLERKVGYTQITRLVPQVLQSRHW